MWYVYFTAAVVAHLGVSFLLGWWSRSHTAFSEVPPPGTVEHCRDLASAINEQQGTDFRHEDLMVFHTRTTEEWSARPWVLVYCIGGLLVGAAFLVLHAAFAWPI